MKYTNARATYNRLTATLGELADPRHRMMLEVLRNHWWGEVISDLEGIMRTLPKDKVHFRFDGHDFLMGRQVIEFTRAEQARELYASVIAQGVNPAGPFDEERFTFTDSWMTCEAIQTGLYLGKMFANPPMKLDPEQHYVARWWSMSRHPFDVERRLMLGEIVYSGGPLSIEPVDASMIPRMIEG